MKVLTILVNNETVYEFDRDIDFDERQAAYLDKMDSDMARGIKIKGKLISNPDSETRARFVAMNLIRALQQDNAATISVSCAYLLSRLPGLVEVHVNDSDTGIVIDFIQVH